MDSMPIFLLEVVVPVFLMKRAGMICYDMILDFELCHGDWVERGLYYVLNDRLD